MADSLGNGGLERQLSLVARRLPATCERRVWAMGGGAFAGELVEAGVQVMIRPRRARLDPRPAAQLVRDLLAWRPDVVHSWSWMSTLAAGPTCRSLRIPLVDASIQTGAYRPEFLRLNRLGMAFATLVVGNSHAGLRAWGIDDARGRVVYNGFDETRLPDRSRRPAGDRAHFTAVMTGRMVAVKHYDVVIAAARLLAKQDPGWRFVLIGDGPDRARLMESAGDLTRDRTVVFAPPGLEVLDGVADADAGVLMTDPALAAEGLSNSIMEYMALGLPVVCGDGGGNPELVVDGVTGFVISQADPESLSEKLAYLRAHPDERAAMGAAGRARISTEFSVPLMIERLLAVYGEAITRLQH